MQLLDHAGEVGGVDGMLQRAPDFHAHPVLLQEGSYQRSQGVARGPVGADTEHGGPGASQSLAEGSQACRHLLFGAGLVDANAQNVRIAGAEGISHFHSSQ